MSVVKNNPDILKTKFVPSFVMIKFANKINSLACVRDATNDYIYNQLIYIYVYIYIVFLLTRLKVFGFTTTRTISSYHH